MTASAPATNRPRRYRSPCLLILPSLFLPPLECCFGTSPIQAEKLRPDRKTFGSATVATTAVASTGPTPGASSSLMLISLDPVPGPDQPVELQYLLLDPPQLSPECRKTRTGYLRNSLVVWIGDTIEQFLDTVAPDRCNDPELGKMGPDCIDHCSLLTDEQMARAVEHQAALLLGSLGWHEPHVGPGDCLADGLCVSRVILLPFDIGLHVGRRHQPHGVTKCLELARPMVRRGAGFDTDQTWR